ncbi:hypothetical protein COCON_G00053060 [Conger conger]|uniref:Glypican-3 n=1 Tax=Conger conger TaxID=82655 RepID=A0A9Q1DVV4_CONCO|nr:hypothetical protein COCON_G00053060 [Conger conger]
MAGTPVSGVLLLCASLLPFAQPSGQVPNCQVVRSSFQLLHPGVRWTPETPVSGAELQVCQARGPTCCSRKMEERYLVVARQNMESSVQASSAPLKLLIIQNAAVFQEAFEMVLRHGRNATLLMLREEFSGLGAGTNSAVGQLFLDVSLYILGSDSSVDDMVTSFFSRLFPLAYRRLLGAGEGNGGGGPVSDECLRGSWRAAGAFGPYPKLAMTRLSRALLTTRVFLQALNLGIEVVNTTHHLRAGRECGRALLRLWHCPLCLGLSPAPPCRGACLAAMRGCLGGAGEVQPHWRGYVEGLGALDGVMRAERGDVEAAVLGLPALVRLGLRHALAARGRIVSMVSSMCARSPQRVSRSAAPPPGRAPPAPKPQQPLPFDPEETLAGRRREFINSLRSFSSFYSGLGEALCSREPGVLNDSLCWNGTEVTDRFPAPGSKRAPTHSADSRPRGPEPVISQIIDKLKHINQLLSMVTVPDRPWRARPRGGAIERRRGGDDDDEDGEGLVSGDCDDEDECNELSGLGPPPRRKRLRIFADLADNLAIDDLTFHQQLLTPLLSTGGEGASSVKGGARGQSGATPGAMALLTVPVLLLRLN